MKMLLANKLGWIGVDVGTSTLKVAQVARSNGGLRLVGAISIPRRTAWSDIEDFSTSDALSSVDEMCAAASLEPSFRGRRAAATLPMSLCNVHTLDHSPGNQHEEDRAVRRAIEMATQSSADNLQFDVWHAEAEEQGQPPKRLNVLAVSTAWSDRLFDDLTQAGWSCQTIDGLPLALARAVAMVDPCDASAPVAALDWGYAKATICVVIEGRPVYVRSFKNCGASSLLNRLCEHLDVNEEEAQRLLQEHGVETTHNGSPAVREVIEEIINEPITQLEREYGRTMSHLQGQRRTIIPKRLYLLGGGATVKGIDTLLACRLKTDVKTWQFGEQYCRVAGQPDLPSCLFGPAIALSALAWEQI